MTGRTRPVERIEVIALVAALVPFVLAVARAASQRWMPVGDAAYFTVRSRDVFGEHHPLLGAWSSGSSVVGVAVNNLGPLQLDVLAPFTTVSADLGTGVGAAVVNAGAVGAVWWVVRRLVPAAAVAAVMTGTLLLMATFGLSWLIDPRQQYAMVLPFFALLWLSAGMWAGVPSAVPLGLLFASLIVHTHFTYVYQAVLLTGIGIVSFVLVTRSAGAQRRWRRTAVISAVVLALAWLQPLIDQVVGTGNLGRVLGPARGGRGGAGLLSGVQIVAGGSLVPPFWLPGSIGAFLAPHDGVTAFSATVAVVIWTAGVGAVAALGSRARRPAATALGAAATVALLSGVAAAALIPVSSFGLVPQNYYWVWSLGAFLTLAGLAGAAELADVVGVTRRLGRLGPSGRWAPFTQRRIVSGALVLIMAVASWPRYPVESVERDEVEADRIGRPLRAQLREALTSHVVDDTVEVDLSRAFFGNNYPFVMLVELQRAGVEFRFPPANRNLDRFGTSRCAPAGEYQRLLLIAGPDPDLTPGSIVIAEVTGITTAELDEHVALYTRFGELLRSGRMTVDIEMISATLGDPVDEISEVLATPGLPAGGLARALDHWRSWGYVDIPAGERVAFERWFDLERRSSADYQTVVVEPPTAIPAGADGASC